MFTFQSDKLTAIDCLHGVAGKYDRLNTTKLRELIAEAKRGNHESLEKIILHTLSLPIWLSRTIGHPSIDREERFGLCLDALIDAILNYNPKRGGFERYAIRCMKNRLLYSFAKYDRLGEILEKTHQPTAAITPDVWTEARESLHRVAEHILIMLDVLRLRASLVQTKHVFIARYNLDGRFTRITLPAVMNRLNIDLDSVCDALEDAWQTLGQAHVTPCDEIGFLVLLENLVYLEEVTETEVVLGVEAA